MFICQLVLPVLLVVVGLSLLLALPNFTQPDYVLSSQQFNPTLNSIDRNYVPFYVEPSSSGIGDEVAQAFNGGSNGQGVQGVAVEINAADFSYYAADDTAGTFAGCSVGAEPLYNMSTYLLDTLSINNEQGSSRYGAIVLSSLTTSVSLVYNMMVNASSIHGVGTSQLYFHAIPATFLFLSYSFFPFLLSFLQTLYHPLFI